MTVRSRLGVVAPAIAAVYVEPFDRRAGQALGLPGGGVEGMAIIGVAGQSQHAEHDAWAVGCGDTDLDAELVLLVRLAFSETLHLGNVERIELVAIVALLRQHPLDAVEYCGEALL
jgi:hypothetical protein